jgi:hypothetical protein
VQGARGERGPAATREQILRAVQAEFDDLKKQLRVQLERTAQMQVQLDAIQNSIKQLLQKA